MEKAVKQPERLAPCAGWWGARVNFRSTADHLGVLSAKRLTSAVPGVFRELVNAMAHPSEARMLACHVCRERCLYRFPEQWLTEEFASRRVNLVCRHRLSGSLEHQRHGLEYRAHLGRSRLRFTGISQGSSEQYVVERAKPRELNPESRVRTCPV
jgi:hypothetical protein